MKAIMKRVCTELKRGRVWADRLWIGLKRGRVWADRVWNSEGHNLSLADEVFAIFAGVTLFVTLFVSSPEWGRSEWLISSPRLIVVIVIAVSATVIAMIVALNQTRLFKRLATYGVALVLGFGGVYWILEESHHDLIPQIAELYALPVGAAVWMLIREITIPIVNAVGDKDTQYAELAEDPSRRP